MKRSFTIVLFLCFTAALFLDVAVAAAEQGKYKVRYQRGYRQWAHMKSMVIEEGHPLYDSFGGIHHIYANKKALKALKSGTAYPKGSVFIFDHLQAVSGENAITEGERKVLGIMQKDPEKFAGTGGWGFEAFKGDTRERVVKDGGQSCFQCHESQKGTEYVFTKHRK